MKTIPWVKGNTMPVAVPLQTKTAVDGKWVIEDYTPPAGSEINVNIVAGQRRYKYDFTLDGNVVRFTDDGHLPVGDYGVEITVKEPDDFNRRTFKCAQIRVYDCTDDVGMLPNGEMLLDAAIFIQGQKGDPFTFEDFTPEEIAELQRPATEAAGVAQQAAQDANDAARLANEKAQYAEQQGDYAKNQGDYAKEKAAEIEQAKGSYNTLGARLDAMDAATGTKMDAPTQEEFDEIFN